MRHTLYYSFVGREGTARDLSLNWLKEFCKRICFMTEICLKIGFNHSLKISFCFIGTVHQSFPEKVEGPIFEKNYLVA